MSVRLTPSTVNVPAVEPLPEKLDCWPLSEPATLTRSICTPGTLCRMTHGSRAVGMDASSACVMVAPVDTRFVSRMGASPVTTTVAATDETFIVIVNSVFLPMLTVTFSRVTVANPCSAIVNV